MAGAVLLVAVAAASAFGLRGSAPAAQAAKDFGLTPMQMRLLSGTAREALAVNQSVSAKGAAAALAATMAPTTVTGCPINRGADVRVNQECLNQSDPDLTGRGQAQNEAYIAQDPYHRNRMVASSNDYRRGDGNCYAYVSNDTGRTWHDSTIPMSFTRGGAFGAARQYWGAGGDTSTDFDTKGNAYVSCQVFNRGAPTSSNPDLSSAFYVFRSSGRAIGQAGGQWTFPGRPVAEFADLAGETGALLDKQLLTVDNHRGSPFQDRVYVTWTFFAPDGTAYIYEAHSSDYGETFSEPVVVSNDSPLCTNPGVEPTHGNCTFNQFSQPFTGPDGALYVAWSNFNNATSHPIGDDDGGNDDGARGSAAADDDTPEPAENFNQILLAKSTDGGQTFSPPVLVSKYYDLPDCLTYQGSDPGRSCVPEKGDTNYSVFRAVNYPVGAVNPRDAKDVVVTFGSYINRHSNEGNGCVPTGFSEDTGVNLFEGVKTLGACNNDILVSRSADAGATFTGTTTDPRELPTTPDSRRADQFWQWADFDPRGRLAVMSYDRQYGSDEVTGYSDVTVSGSKNLGASFASLRATTSSMPPPTQFPGPPGGSQFYGDYYGLAAEDGVHPIWSDTRDLNVTSCRNDDGSVATPPDTCLYLNAQGLRANDQNAYTRSVNLPTP